jgi:lysophospholipase L1-like esterase
MLKTKYIKCLVVISISGIILFALFIGGKKTKQLWIIERTIQSEHWQKRAKEIESAPIGKYKTIFLGNSLTEMWDVNYYFNDSTILNAGITGDFSEGLLKRITPIIKLEPKKVFIEIGINDIIEKISLSVICANYEQLIYTIQRESPQTKIYIQSNLPLIINRFSFLTDNDDVNECVVEQNKNLMAIAAKYHCTYIDIYSRIAKEKNRASLFIWDGIHLTPKAYTIWQNIVRSYLLDNK